MNVHFNFLLVCVCYSLGWRPWNEKGTGTKPPWSWWGALAGTEANWNGNIGPLNCCCSSRCGCWGGWNWNCGWRRTGWAGIKVGVRGRACWDAGMNVGGGGRAWTIGVVLWSLGRGGSGIPSWSASTLCQSSSVPNSSSTLPPPDDGLGITGRCWPCGMNPCGFPASYVTVLVSPNSSTYLQDNNLANFGGASLWELQNLNCLPVFPLDVAMDVTGFNSEGPVACLEPVGITKKKETKRTVIVATSYPLSGETVTYDPSGLIWLICLRMAMCGFSSGGSSGDRCCGAASVRTADSRATATTWTAQHAKLLVRIKRLGGGKKTSKGRNLFLQFVYLSICGASPPNPTWPISAKFLYVVVLTENRMFRVSLSPFSDFSKNSLWFCRTADWSCGWCGMDVGPDETGSA